MRGRGVAASLLTVLTGCAGGTQSAFPQVAAKVNIHEILSVDISDASPVFLSDDIIAILVRTGEKTALTWMIIVFQRTGSQLKILHGPKFANQGGEIFSATNGSIIISSRSRTSLYSSDLTESRELPIHMLPKLFPRSAVVGQSGDSGWELFSLPHEPSPLRQGEGELLAVSSNVVVSRSKDVIRTESLNGKLLGTIPVPPKSTWFNFAEIAGKGRLFLSAGASDNRIVNLNGALLLKTRSPDGWGFRHGWSDDGDRMLFDHFTTRQSSSEKVLSWTLDTLGVVLPKQPTGEIVTVLDANSGITCFDLESPRKMFGMSGTYHADLSPSGGFVAVATPLELSVYRLPRVCLKK